MIQQHKSNGNTIGHTVTEGTGGAELDLLLTIGEVAELLKVPVSWVYERTRRRSIGRIPGFRLGKYWRFRRTELLTWIEQQRVEARRNA